MLAILCLTALTKLTWLTWPAFLPGDDNPPAGPPYELTAEDGILLITADGNYIGAPNYD
jgi:hypothetical protein